MHTITSIARSQTHTCTTKGKKPAMRLKWRKCFSLSNWFFVFVRVPQNAHVPLWLQKHVVFEGYDRMQSSWIWLMNFIYFLLVCCMCDYRRCCCFCLNGRPSHFDVLLLLEFVLLFLLLFVISLLFAYITHGLNCTRQTKTTASYRLSRCFMMITKTIDKLIYEFLEKHGFLLMMNLVMVVALFWVMMKKKMIIVFEERMIWGALRTPWLSVVKWSRFQFFVG